MAYLIGVCVRTLNTSSGGRCWGVNKVLGGEHAPVGGLDYRRPSQGIPRNVTVYGKLVAI